MDPGLIKAQKPLSLRNSQQRRKIQVQMFTAKCQGPRPRHGQRAVGSGRRAHGSKGNQSRDIMTAVCVSPRILEWLPDVTMALKTSHSLVGL